MGLASISCGRDVPHDETQKSCRLDLRPRSSSATALAPELALPPAQASRARLAGAWLRRRHLRRCACRGPALPSKPAVLAAEPPPPAHRGFPLPAPRPTPLREHGQEERPAARSGGPAPHLSVAAPAVWWRVEWLVKAAAEQKGKRPGFPDVERNCEVSATRSERGGGSRRTGPGGAAPPEAASAACEISRGERGLRLLGSPTLAEALRRPRWWGTCGAYNKQHVEWNVEERARGAAECVRAAAATRAECLVPGAVRKHSEALSLVVLPPPTGIFKWLDFTTTFFLSARFLRHRRTGAKRVAPFYLPR